MNQALASVAWPWLLATIIAASRPIGMLAINPLLARAHLTGFLRGAVAIALAAPAVPPLVRKVAALQQAPLDLLLLAMKEAILGGVIGFMIGVPFWAFQFAGDVLDQQRGATSGRLNDPAGGDDVSITGTLLVVAGAALFVSAGGLQALASLLYASWAIWPALSALPAPTTQAPTIILGLLETVIRQGFLMAIPIVLAMLLGDVSLMLIGRFAPQFRIEDAATAARNLVFCLSMPPYCLFLLSDMGRALVIPSNLLDQLQTALP